MKAFEYVIFAWDVLCAFPRRRAVDRRVMNALKRVREIGDGRSGHRLTYVSFGALQAKRRSPDATTAKYSRSELFSNHSLSALSIVINNGFVYFEL